MHLEFEDCLLDLKRRELSRDNQIVATTPMVFDLLVYLANNRDRVVSKDELMDTVWSGRIVSESTLGSQINALRRAVGDDGQQQRIIRTVARKGFRFTAVVQVHDLDTETSSPHSDTESSTAHPIISPTLPAKPSIAILPFVNLSAEREQEYLADGVVEDIIAALSQYKWLFVVARNSSFTYKGRTLDVKQVGRELGVRYLLEGSWRKVNNRVRMTGQLVDTTNGSHHWAGRFEGVLDDIFDLQDQFTMSIVGAIAPELERAEIERTRHKSTENLDAYDLYLRGMSNLHHGSRESIDRALEFYNKAIAYDANFSSAYAMSAWCFCWRKANGWMQDQLQETASGLKLARIAVELDRGDAVALTRSGHALGYLAGDYQGGIALIDKALVLNPNLAAAWFLGGFLRIWKGEPATAIEHLTHALRLSPLDPELYRMHTGLSVAHLFLGQHDEASIWAEKAFNELPSFLLPAAVLAASQAQAGRIAEAKITMTHIRKLNPALRLSNILDWLPIYLPEHRANLVEGLQKAGLPK